MSRKNQPVWKRPLETVAREMKQRHGADASRQASNRLDNADSRGNIPAAEFYGRLMDYLMKEAK
jgi:hypothetical protein